MKSSPVARFATSTVHDNVPSRPVFGSSAPSTHRAPASMSSSQMRRVARSGSARARQSGHQARNAELAVGGIGMIEAVVDGLHSQRGEFLSNQPDRAHVHSIRSWPSRSGPAVARCRSPTPRTDALPFSKWPTNSANSPCGCFTMYVARVAVREDRPSRPAQARECGSPRRSVRSAGRITESKSSARSAGGERSSRRKPRSDEMSRDDCARLPGVRYRSLNRSNG